MSAPRGPRRPLSVAPMLDWTDRHFRQLLRQLTRRTLLYTEMVSTGALLHGDRERLLAYDPAERPLALQLGGDDPAALATCARLAEEWGYDEVNLNVGCPSARVQQGRFGVCLMANPEVVAAAVGAMRDACLLPVTVKHRIGLAGHDDFEHLLAFVDTVARAGADRFIVHARSAHLDLSPEQNRKVPPLRREVVRRLREERPHLRIEVNGEVRDLDESLRLLADFDGVMIGRRAYVQPWLLAGADARVFGEAPDSPTPGQVVRHMAEYAERWLRQGGRLHDVTRHMLGLFAGQPGARAWRRALSAAGQSRSAEPQLLLDALAAREAEDDSIQG